MSDSLTWLVRQLHWRKFPVGSDPRYVRLPGATTVAVFDDRHEADADRRAREVAVRSRVNPFQCGFDLADLTHIPDFAFKDFLMDDSIRPAKYDSTAQLRWDKWWDKQSPAWSADRKARIWEALDKVRFFEVVEREDGAELFVAVEGESDLEPGLRWDRWRLMEMGFGTEGGRPARAFRSRADAEAHLELIAEAAGSFARSQPDTDPFRHPDAASRLPADRAHDVPLGGELTADRPTVFVVCRVGLTNWWGTGRVFPGWQFEVYPTGEAEWADTSGDFDIFPRRVAVRRPRLVPEAAFTTREAAEEDARERMRLTRRLLNPTLIYDFARDYPAGVNPAALWRAANVNNAPDAEFDAAWAGLSHLSLYQVVEIEWDG